MEGDENWVFIEPKGNEKCSITLMRTANGWQAELEYSDCRDEFIDFANGKTKSEALSGLIEAIDKLTQETLRARESALMAIAELELEVTQ